MISWADQDGTFAPKTSYSVGATYTGSASVADYSWNSEQQGTTSFEGWPLPLTLESDTTGQTEYFTTYTTIHPTMIVGGVTSYISNDSAGNTTYTKATGETRGGTNSGTSSNEDSTTDNTPLPTTQSVGYSFTTTDTQEGASTYTTETYTDARTIHSTRTTTSQTFNAAGNLTTLNVISTTATTGSVTDERFVETSYVSTFTTTGWTSSTQLPGYYCLRQFHYPEGCDQLFVGTLGHTGTSASCEVFTATASFSYAQTLSISASTAEDIGAGYTLSTYDEDHWDVDFTRTGSLPSTGIGAAPSYTMSYRDTGYLHSSNVASNAPVYSGYTINCPASISLLLSTSSNRRTVGELHYKGYIVAAVPFESEDTLVVAGTGGAVTSISGEIYAGFSNSYTCPLSVGFPVGVFDITTLNDAGVTVSSRETFTTTSTFTIASSEMIAYTPIPYAEPGSSYGEVYRCIEQPCTFPQA